jgi:hypothetical protein
MSYANRRTARSWIAENLLANESLTDDRFRQIPIPVPKKSKTPSESPADEISSSPVAASQPKKSAAKKAGTKAKSRLRKTGAEEEACSREGYAARGEEIWRNRERA